MVERVINTYNYDSHCLSRELNAKLRNLLENLYVSLLSNTVLLLYPKTTLLLFSKITFLHSQNYSTEIRLQLGMIVTFMQGCENNWHDTLPTF